MQNLLFPIILIPQTKEVKITHLPPHSEVGGDFYDVELGKTKLDLPMFRGKDGCRPADVEFSLT